MNKYQRMIQHKANGPTLIVDVYDVLEAFRVNDQPIAHAIKKLLCAGTRGHKDKVQDLKEAIQSIERQLEKESVDKTEQAPTLKEELEKMELKNLMIVPDYNITKIVDKHKKDLNIKVFYGTTTPIGDEDELINILKNSYKNVGKEQGHSFKVQIEQIGPKFFRKCKAKDITIGKGNQTGKVKRYLFEEPTEIAKALAHFLVTESGINNSPYLCKYKNDLEGLSTNVVYAFNTKGEFEVLSRNANSKSIYRKRQHM